MPYPFKSKKKYIILTITACLTSGIVAYSISYFCFKSNSKEVAVAECNPHMNLTRLRDFKLVAPLVFSDLPDEDQHFDNLKTTILSQINTYKSQGQLIDAGLYLRDLTDGSWMAINATQNFDPGSILKMSILIAHLKKAQKNPGHLDSKIYFSSPNTAVYKQSIEGKTLQALKYYSIRELMRYMIVESDNQANALLNNSIEPAIALKVFSDLELSVPDPKAATFPMNVRDLSKFMRALHNGTYLSPEISEFALELLTEVKFSDGIRSGFPKEITMAHKFGERGYPGSNINELHETAIVYLENRPILITIMTKGTSQSEQAGLIREISSTIAAYYGIKAAS